MDFKKVEIIQLMDEVEMIQMDFEITTNLGWMQVFGEKEMPILPSLDLFVNHTY
jgi:hypothetical protein